MIRNVAQVVGAVILAITFTLPSTVAGENPTIPDRSWSTVTERDGSSTRSDFAFPYLPDHYISSPVTEVSDPQQARDLLKCVRVSLFCEQYINRGNDDGASSEDSESDPDVSDRNRERSSSANQQNRSVVGWQSASVSALQNEEYPDPVSLEIPSLSISADISGVSIDQNRAMEVPDDFNTVGWYRHGPSPGQDGSSVIAGHLDDYNGRSVFFDLQYIELDATITVGYDDGSRQEFRVTNKDAYDSGNLPTDRLFRREGVPVLSLLTCGGTWDSSRGRYSETVVVYAIPVED